MNNATLINQTELWKPIPGFPKYEVSNLGRLRSYWGRSGDSGICLGGVDPDGYRKFVLTANNGRKKTFKMSTLVAAAFCGDRPHGMVIAHENGVRTDDRADNLTYKTQQANIDDKRRHGTVATGEGHGMSRLRLPQVIEIKAASSKRLSVLAAKYGVHKCTILDIRKGRTWVNA